MALFNITGKVKIVGPVQKISDNFSKRELIVLESVGQRDQPLMFEATQDRMSLLEGINPGDEVKVSFYINGREWTARDGNVKYFVSLSVNQVEKVNQVAEVAAGAPPSGNTPPPITQEIVPDDLEEDDLPF